MAKDLVKMSLLYDLYGGMLTEKQRELFTLYYEEDLSLAEIAQNRRDHEARRPRHDCACRGGAFGV